MQYRTLAKRVGDAVRLAEVVQVLVRHGFADLVRRLGLYEGIPAKVLRSLRLIEEPSSAPDTIGARLRAALTELGPTFVKLGQVLSTRPDVVGKDIADALSHLQDKVDALPFGQLRPILEEDLETKLEECFSEFNENCVAAASLSQVYRARTKSGRDVAVKIQRPNARKRIEADLSLLHAIAEWVSEHVEDLEWSDPVGVVEEFERSIMRELDFAVEARVIQKFRLNYSGNTAVYVPRVEQELSNHRVLTMDWIDGIRIDALDRYADRGCDPRIVARNGCDTLCRQIFEFHLFHADPHPGNILVTRDNQIAFLDYGMVGHLEPADVHAMADLLRSIFEEDSARCVRALLAFTTTGEAKDPEAFGHEVAAYIAFEAQTVVGKSDVGRLMDQITTILRRHQLQLSPRFSLFMKAMATIESTAHALDEDLDMGPIVKPYVERILTNRFSPQHLAQESQEGIAALLRLARELPGDLQRLARTLGRGKLKVQLGHEGLDRLATVTDRASNRIAFSVIAGSLIVGSSLLLLRDVGAQTLGFAGFIIAAALGVGLLISILRSKNY